MTETAKNNLKEAETYRPHLHRIHDLKILPIFYGPVVRGEKPFELRKNDRDYRVGDRLKLREFCPEKQEYTGSHVMMEVTYVLENEVYLQKGIVALGIKR